jgi:ABC-2 type transport system permease protein
MDKIIILAHKDLRLLFRDRTGFFFTLMWPLVIAIFFGTLFGGGGGGTRSAIPIVIVDEDESEGSRAFIARLDAAPEIDIRVTDRADATESVRKRKAVAYVVLKAGFGEAAENVFWGGSPEAEVGTDPARQAEASMVEGILMKYAAELMQETMADTNAQQRNLRNARRSLESDPYVPPGVRSNLGRLFEDLDRFYGDASFGAGDDTAGVAGGGLSGFQPIVIERADVIVMKRQGPSNAYAISFPQGIIWGIIGTTAGFAISIVVERTRGTLMRLQVAPLNRAHILAGKALACFGVILAISIGLLTLARFAFGVVPGSLPLLALAFLSSSVAFVGIMMLLSVLGKTEQAVGGIGWAALIVMSMLGGGMIPLFVMPGWMHSVSAISPVKWSILAMEGAVWRQFSLAEMLQPCGILIGVGIACFLVGVRAFAWSSQN